ncbi:LPD38 domain-containing protein [Arsukibacterium indicum]|uniref:Large polyvalent protein-associated domain-containing protein n=1 Tax=Arsukibacterium indicum TaxID=2848612 RepID=A0ABS6MH38_9GAMM|nr:LPD38 domain-containing protein [Arsukibacterium indicum]MBV2128146.1 hypothetical protein [Arsukibacterium indicum]
MASTPNYFNRPMPKLYIPSSTQQPKQQGRFGDTVDAFQAGGLSAIGGIFDFVGADGIAQQFYSRSDAQQDTMSDRGKQAMGKSFFDQNEQGDIQMGDGLTDIDTWLLTLANVAGQFVPTAIPGAGLAGGAAKVASLGAKGKAAANIVGMGATGGAAATGQGMEQARQEIQNMPDAVLAQSPIFRDVFKGIYASKTDWTDEQKWDAAKDAIAARVADEVRSDPKVLLANFGASAIGDPIIGKALMGARLAKSGAMRSAVKGFAVEGSTEAAQAGVQEYAINQAVQPIDGRDPADGVAVAALNEGIAGGGFGAGAGLLGGIANRNQAQTPPPAAEQPKADPVADSIRESNPDLAGAMDSLNETMTSSKAAIDEIINYDQPTAARQAGFNTGAGAGKFGDFITSPVQQSLDEMRAKTVADLVNAAANFQSPTEQDRFSPARYQFQGEVLPAQKQQTAGLLAGATMDGEQAQFLPDNRLTGEYQQPIRTQPRPQGITDKGIIFGEDGRPAQQAQERADNLQRDTQRFADNARNNAQPRIPQKDIVFASNETGATVKQSGQPFQSPKEALASKTARAARKAGNEIEAVPFADGFGWRAVQDSKNKTTPAADLAGQVIDKEWTAFADETGTKKVPRAEMPQIKAEHRGALTQFMKGRGITHESQTVPAADLKPTQEEFSPAKVKKAMEFDGGNRSILVSSDGYVLDGHHQWLAAREKAEAVDIIRLDAPIDELIPLAKEFPSSTVADGQADTDATQTDTEATSEQEPAAANESEAETTATPTDVTEDTQAVADPEPDSEPNITNQTPADAGVSVSEIEPSEPIDDFGEKIGGARKDVWGGFSDAINSDASTAELPLSKAFPEPDYVKMAADGVPRETLALIAAMRAEIPTKPRDTYKVRRWAEKVDVLRGFAADIISGDVPLENVLAAMRKGGGDLAAIADAIPAIAKANPETLKLAAKYRLDSGAFTMFKGQEYRPAKVFYFPKNGRTDILDLASDNQQTALDNLSKLIEAEASANPDSPGKKQSNIGIYTSRATKQVYLGWKGGSGVLRIQDFGSVNAARDYLKNNRADIEAKLQRLKDTPGMRRAENRDRIGPARFSGNVTPAIFADTFGFRGVEFGNWVEQGRRQKDLNEAYDALMDLAEVIGVPPKAIALNGELGMAFGARGKGGKRGFKAHYERDYVVINMTKEKGAGSLAHEWWHAVDNYFARMVGKPAAFATDGSGVRGSDMRPEVRQAFDGVMSAIRQSGLIKRSANLDHRRSKPYWSTTQEASARSFEAFVIDELAAKEFSNDYLANIIEPEAWNALEEMQGNLPDQTYPYPTKAEQATINPAYRKLFDTLQTKETDKGTMLFSREANEDAGIQFAAANYDTMRNQKAKGVSPGTLEVMVKQFMKKLNNAAGIKVEVLRNQQEAELKWNMSLSGSIVRGAYDDTTKTAYLIAGNFDSIEHARRTLAHEVIAHGGLQSVIGPVTYKQFLDRINTTRTKPSFRQRWAGIMNDYSDLTPEKQAEEFFARFVEDQPDSGSLKYWYQAMMRWLNNQLAKVGITRPSDTDMDFMRDMMDSIVQGFKSGRAPRRQAGKAVAFDSNTDADADQDLQFSRTAEPDTRTAKEKLGLGEQADETLKEKATARYHETADTLKSSKFWQRLNEGIFDGMSGIKQAEESVGVTDPNRQGYVSARLASGLADVLHGVFHYGAPEWKNGVVARKADTKGLLEVFSTLGDELNNWLAWMGANRAEQLMAEGRENNLTAADIAELKALAAGKEEQFEAVRQEYNKINSAIIDLAQQAGLISEAQRSGFDEEWYVPFFRDMDVDPEMQGIASMVHGPKSKNGIANQNAQLKELKGGKQSTKDLLENIIQRHSTLIDASLKNNAMLEIVANLSGTDYMQPVTSPDIVALSQAELRQISRVKVMRDGKPEAYAVSDPALLRGLLQISDPGSKSLFNRLGRSAKRFLTAGITLSPDFIAKNFVRDAAHAWMVNKDDFKFGSDSIKGLRKAFKEDEAYRDLIFSGAAFQGGYVHGADPEAASQQVRRALKSKGLTVNQVNSYMDSLVTKGGQLLEKYRNASDKVENANRLMTYEASLKSGKSARESAYYAKDLMDYSLKGNFKLIGTMIDFLPFFNARLQGMSKLIRAARAGDGDRVAKVLSAKLAMKGMKVAAFSLALAALNDEDERYQELADWDKDANWHFWLGDQHLRIPKPFELGIIFGTFPERMLHYGSGSQPASDLGKAVSHAVFNTLALNPIPQLALPLAEMAFNKSFFRGTDIENMSDENKLKEDRYNAYTSDTAKLIGKISKHFGVSPKQVEHLVVGYTGTIGGYVLSMSDAVARQMLGIEAADAPISRYPVIKAFYQGDSPKGNTKFQQEFYDSLKAATQAYGSYKRATEEGNTERQQKLLEDNSKQLRSRIQLNRVQRQVSALNKQAERVNLNKSLSGTQKREQLDDIARRKNALYQAAYVRFNLGEW